MNPLRNAAPKVFALLVAIVIWLAASEERREDILERNFEVPLALVGVPSDLVISGEVENTVTVRLRGPASQVRSLNSDTLEATVDLTDSRPGPLTIAIPPSALNIPSSVEVISMQPARIRLQIEQRRQKVVSIRPYLVGAPADGFVLENIDVRPANALISGPASLVEDVTEIPTERIILSGRAATFRVGVSVISDYPLVRVVEPSVTQVTVTIQPQAPPPAAPAGEGADPRSP